MYYSAGHQDIMTRFKLPNNNTLKPAIGFVSVKLKGSEE
jgi:hypothetical protein